MELKLNVYERGSLVKTYTSQSFRLSTGVVRKIIKQINIEKFVKDGKINEESSVFEIVKVISNSFDVFIEILMDIFPDITEEECENTDVFEVAKLIFAAITEAFSSLNNIQSKKK